MDRSTWQDFVAGRYDLISAFNTAYGLPVAQRYSSFTDISLPTSLPADGAPLLDWYEFESIVLPMQRTAHQFTVLLPAPSYYHGRRAPAPPRHRAARDRMGEARAHHL